MMASVIAEKGKREDKRIRVSDRRCHDMAGSGSAQAVSGDCITMIIAGGDN